MEAKQTELKKIKGRRFLRKALRFRMLFVYLIVILVLVLIGCYTIGGLKAGVVTTDDNAPFSYDGFVDQSKVQYEDGTDYAEKVAENSNFELWFDPSTTLVTVVDKETGYTYSTAQKTTDSELGANIVIEYANQKTGKIANTAYDSMAYSVQYYNSLTDSKERHYYTKNVENGVQILYNIGQFSAGLDYLPQFYYVTMYKPDSEAFYDRYGEYEQEKYEAAMEKWVGYMQTLGCADPLNASYKEYMSYLTKTFDEQFRGNVSPVVKVLSEQGVWNYTGSVYIYTREAFEYFKGLIEDGSLPSTGNEKFGEIQRENNTDNPYWIINNVDTSIFTDYIGVYFDTEDSPLTINPFMQGYAYKFLKETAYNQITTTDDDFHYIYYRRQNIKSNTLNTAYSLLYFTKQFEYVGRKYVDQNGEPLIVGGVPQRDEDGNFIYVDGQLQTEYYSLAKTAEFNALFGKESETSLALFQIGLQFVLTEDGLKATVLGDSLIDAQNSSKSTIAIDEMGKTISTYNNLYVLYDMKFLPYFTYFDNAKLDDADKETGLFVIPDGSGATINFNNGKNEMGASAVNTTYYGNDAAFTSKQISEETDDLMLGMYGMIYTTPSKPRSILAIIAKGGNQVSLYANTTKGTNSEVSQAYFNTTLRANETVKIGAWSSKNIFTKWASSLVRLDFEFEYHFNDYDDPEDANYTAIADQYRAYLIKAYGLEDKDNTTNTVVDLNFLGSFEKYALFLGFKYKTPDSLTTFKQAEEIIEELTTGVEVDGVNKKINNASVTYTAWSSEELAYQVGGSLRVSGVLGGKRGLQNFVKYLSEKNINYYGEQFVTTSTGYDLPFGHLKYTARSVSNNPARTYQFDVATQRQNKKVASTYVINPKFFEDIATKLNNKYSKLNVGAKANAKTGYYLVDLGNKSAGNFKKGDVIYGQESIYYQQRTLAKLQEAGYLLKIKAPYDYAFKYADAITDAPLVSTARPIYDSIIPLYQLVISGLIEYTTEATNGTSSKSHYWFLSKAIETGSNLSFSISYENPTILLETDYTFYYQSYYQNWKEYIVEMASTIDSLGIMNGRLVEHKTIGKNIAYVRYETNSGAEIKLYVNTTSTDFVYDTVTIPAYGYVVL